jgi:hypothetical protein
MANTQNEEFNYMLLDRLRSDCEYYLGYGNRSVKRLWAESVAEHIAKMRDIYQNLPKKPEWLTEEQIDSYEARMV